ncbi:MULTISPECIES: monofunctional biosynthetic peptidoglycan transglycosylase [unclassified Acinetobacter]|uniref:monofunctional biosynthetic peptidoglycan transglycosylase n=1 Tax=unclassified Acinetobacter TaxID=196816 RepID=UPI0035B9CCB7
MLKWFFRLFMLVCCTFLAVQLWVFTSLAYWRTNPVEFSMFMRLHYFEDSNNKIYHRWVDYDQISPQMRAAVIAAEDAQFVNHSGFDFDGMIQAIKRNGEEGEIVVGGSTISQQLSKNLFLYPDRSYIRKGQEAIATWMMEQMWPKKRILEVYLNSVEFGENIYGVEAASLHYFGKSAKDLNRQQAIFLASVLPNPKYYGKNQNDRSLKRKQRFISRNIVLVQVPS